MNEIRITRIKCLFYVLKFGILGFWDLLSFRTEIVVMLLRNDILTNTGFSDNSVVDLRFRSGVFGKNCRQDKRKWHERSEL